MFLFCDKDRTIGKCKYLIVIYVNLFLMSHYKKFISDRFFKIKSRENLYGGVIILNG